MKRVLNNIDNLECPYCDEPIKAGEIIFMLTDEYGVTTKWHGEHGKEPKKRKRYLRKLWRAWKLIQ